jgi:hypothetical protein
MIRAFDFSAMRLNDGAANGKSHAQSLLLGARKSLEQSFDVFFGNAAP